MDPTNQNTAPQSVSLCQNEKKRRREGSESCENIVNIEACSKKRKIETIDKPLKNQKIFDLKSKEEQNNLESNSGDILLEATKNHTHKQDKLKSHYCEKKFQSELALSDHETLGCTETSSDSSTFLSENMKKKLPDPPPLNSNQIEKSNTHHIEVIPYERTAILEIFLHSIKTMIEQNEEWSELVKKCESFMDSHGVANFSLYTSPFNFDSKIMTPDKIAMGHYKKCGSVVYMPVKVLGDGNCLYRAMSVIMTGFEGLWLELRVSTTITHILHREAIEASAKAKGLYLTGSADYMNDILNAATVGIFQSTINVIAMCYAVDSSIFLLYPFFGVGLTNMNALTNHGLLAGELDDHYGFHIMWSGDATSEYGWNHFVPLLPAEKNR